ncbi:MULTISPECIES: 1-hydroxycarotenoid 3,4-desaturase CrtD [unclassified Novosphingobium]|uniref:1-hydroxycarotenoid 3,4-desaturase CrtD n=1 Tax=unclassified Novosphingobium TaxID=2644732 RepID=UPI00146C6509|nr:MULTISPECIES: 1-hydroxycarotenoid 3,4-desaturase CrtD [unclassified Novosphingobium]NMN05003.1 1-hydroxycarotenoid 3,4-desaturase [Novosphingobium sp. SG919]NMN87297.1 1-hydroxycarotenoid 3,4-desaturase [Novosphingobium sp. SG916]
MAARVAIIGAGIGGLAAAALLAARGHAVTVIEKAAHPGGKARQIAVDGVAVDAGPTVFTLRDVFDEIFHECGASLADHVTIRRAQVLARHAWDETRQLDLHADPARSEEAIGDFAGAGAAAGFRAFRAEAARIHGILDATMLRGSKLAWPPSLMWRIGLWRLGDLLAIRPYESLWAVLGQHFADPRLRQLFARYATYCGSSPFATPATLMLIAHVESLGVWLIDGGMSALAQALMNLAKAHGAQFRFGTGAAMLETALGRASGVVLANGDHVAADAVIANADPEALAAGRLGPVAAMAVSSHGVRKRSLSAMVWLAHARSSGSFPLQRHNVLFSPDYPREFRDIAGGRPPADPSVYVCAQDRDGALANDGGRERLQIIVNAPANGDSHVYTEKERDQCTLAMSRALQRCGLELEVDFPRVLLTPNTFETFSPSTGGAIYGRASHGWAASFLRQGTRTRIPGLYCAGGSTHPGAGVPMAALSGRLAAQVVMQDLASMRRFHPVATAGGMSTRSAPAGATG